MKHSKLTTKLAFSIGTAVFVSLAVISVTALLLSNSYLTQTIDDELSEKAKNNASIVQSIITQSSKIANGLQDYLENSYKVSASQSVEERNSTKNSSAYNKPISAYSEEIENFIVNTAWSGLKQNDDIETIGIYFEPNQFDKLISDYSIYLNNNDAANNTIQTKKYADFSNQEIGRAHV